MESSEQKNEPIDIVLPLGRGTCRANWELRFALRSIERHAQGWRRVVIVGHDPGFLQGDRVRVIKFPEPPFNKEARIAAKVTRAFKDPRVSDYVAFWNDDFILMRETDVRRIPAFRRPCSLAQSAKGSSGGYQKALRTTGRLLKEAGRPDWQYDIHTPIVFHRPRFEALRQWWVQSEASTNGLVVKSVYANNARKFPGPVYDDCKIRGFTAATLGRIKKRFVFSYADTAFLNGLKEWLLMEYPNPSSMEIPPKEQP